MEGKEVNCPKCGAENPIYIQETDSYQCRNEDCNFKFSLITKPIPKKIFISYGHDEFKPLAVKIKEDLERLGHEVWFDQSELKAGRDWEIAIEEGLKGTQIVLVMMTPYSMRRPDGYCLNELSMACTLRKEIVPVMVKDCIPPLSIHRIQWLDFREWPCSEERYNEKFSTIRDIIEGNILGFEGEHSYLLSKLKPIDFKAEIDEHIRNFYGREWIFDEVKEWLYHDPESRVFFLTGGPGVGKTAICAMLCHKFSEVKAYHLVKYGDLRKSNALECVLSIAYQLSTQFQDYAERLYQVDFKGIREKNALTIFDELIVQLLHGLKPPSKPFLILIDALDEAKIEDNNEIVTFLSKNFHLVPSWLKLFITSRPEKDILNSLASLNPFSLDTEDERNIEDIEGYLKLKLKEYFPNKNIDKALKLIIERSEGVFLYIREVLKELKMNRLTLDRPEDFPYGLKQVYKDFFERQFPNPRDYESFQRPLLEIIAAAKEPFKIKQIREILGWDDYTQKHSIDPLISFLEIDDGKIKLFHKSILEWLTNPDTGSKFFISTLKGDEKLSNYGWDIYKSDLTKMPSYFLTYLPLHLLALDKQNELSELLADLKYINEIDISVLSNFPESLLSLYYGTKPEQTKTLIDLKNLIDKPIPRMESIVTENFGVQIINSNVVDLKLYNRWLTHLPDSLGNLPALKLLDLGMNKLIDLPKTIGKLSNLEELYLDGNKLKTLPDSIGNILSLKILNLFGNQLSYLPESIGKLVSLKKLVLFKNNLISLPESIGNLKSLINLDLYCNDLKALPGSIGNLSLLKSLNLWGNQLSKLPKSIGNLKSLQILNLMQNKLEFLPNSLCALNSLQNLIIYDNNISSLPKSIGNLSALRIFGIGGNMIKNFPKSMENLKSLQILVLKHNMFSRLPETIRPLEQKDTKIYW